MSQVVRLGPEDADALGALRREALAAAPESFSSSPADDRFAAPGFAESILRDRRQAVFGAFDPDLVGLVGVVRGRQAKLAHRCDLWGMYVSPASRRKGLAGALLWAAIDFARSLPGVTHISLSVSARSPEARALYEKEGFLCWGTEPCGLRVAGDCVDEHHMTLELKVDAPVGRG